MLTNKTMFYICLFFVVIGAFLVNWENSLLGIVIIGLFSYLAGVYGTKEAMSIDE